MKLSYVLVALVVIALVVAGFAGGYFVGRTNAPLAANYAYGPGAMLRGQGGFGMVGGYSRHFGAMRGFERGSSPMGGFLPGFGALGIGLRFLTPLTFLALIALVVILLVRKPKPAVVAPVTTTSPAESKQV